jgi:hypothetical protein
MRGIITKRGQPRPKPGIRHLAAFAILLSLVLAAGPCEAAGTSGPRESGLISAKSITVIPLSDAALAATAAQGVPVPVWQPAGGSRPGITLWDEIKPPPPQPASSAAGTVMVTLNGTTIR